MKGERREVRGVWGWRGHVRAYSCPCASTRKRMRRPPRGLGLDGEAWSRFRFPSGLRTALARLQHAAAGVRRARERGDGSESKTSRPLRRETDRAKTFTVKKSDFYRSSVLNRAGHGGSSDHAPSSDHVPSGAYDGERPSASSRRRPAASRVASVPRRACTCRPMGRPSSDCPAGRVRMGWPVTAVGQL